MEKSERESHTAHEEVELLGRAIGELNFEERKLALQLLDEVEGAVRGFKVGHHAESSETRNVSAGAVVGHALLWLLFPLTGFFPFSSRRDSLAQDDDRSSRADNALARIADLKAALASQRNKSERILQN